MARQVIRQVILRIRNNGQITLPAKIRKIWNLKSNDEIILIVKENEEILRPRKYVKVSDIAGKLGLADNDEVEFATTDPDDFRILSKKIWQ